MSMHKLFFDIETIANPAAIALMPEPKAPANLKDPEKIRAAIEEKRAALIDSAALDPDYATVRSIGWAVDDDPISVYVVADEGSEFFLSEPQVISSFWDKFAKLGGNCVGYNVLGFDLPFLMRRSMALGVKPQMIPFLARYRAEPVTDLMQILFGWGAMQNKSLKAVAKLYGIPNPLPDVDGSQVKNMTVDELITYQQNDVRITRELYRLMQGIYF